MLTRTDTCAGFDGCISIETSGSSSGGHRLSRFVLVLVYWMGWEAIGVWGSTCSDIGRNRHIKCGGQYENTT